MTEQIDISRCQRPNGRPGVKEVKGSLPRPSTEFWLECQDCKTILVKPFPKKEWLWEKIDETL